MTPEQIVKTAMLYEQRLRGDGHNGIPLGSEDLNKTCEEINNWVKVVDHLCEMAVQIPALVKSGEIDKANRWLGFIQCGMFVFGIYTINQTREHNNGNWGA